MTLLESITTTAILRHSGLRFAAALAASGLTAHLLPVLDGTDGWSLFPPLVAVLVAIATGRLILGLVTALCGAAALSLTGDPSFVQWPWLVFRRALVDFVWLPLSQSFQLYILAFTASLIGMVRVISLAGGTQGIADLLVRKAGGARSSRLAVFLLGLAIFFDDYANTMVVGTTMRPVADRFRVSREKLAYLVDSTAAPVAGIAIISTWIGYEVGLLQDAMTEVGAGISGYELFFRSLPSRFYCFLTLAMVGLSVLLRRDFGPMLRAERRAQRTGEVVRPGSTPVTGGREEQGFGPAPGVVPDWRVAAFPVGLVIFGVLAGMHLDTLSAPEVVLVRSEHSFFSRQYWTIVFSHADGARIMFLAAVSGTVAALLLAVTRKASGAATRRPVPLSRAVTVWLGGITGFHRALVILVLAWAIKEACKAVGTSTYLIASLGSSMPPGLLPIIVFLLASIVAFAIGTSWTTMAILLPTTVPLAFSMGGLPLTVLVSAAVLDGAIFGDHCSPISDTTVLSSIAAACDHMDHVKTQIPYALASMSVAATFGYLGTALLWPAYAGLALGALAIAGGLLAFGGDPEAPEAGAAPC
ncbi:MAG: Na+/H+ antiporter NhaC family protein [Candidatus Latescibacterota bacterium]|nr:Na+/H+ antiporter NhaC family protein [Candidatus Latescibacterota bacterium]